MTDDQTVADLDAMPRARAALAEQGVRFDRSYVSYPVCCPSRATYLSGQYAHNHGVLGLYPPTGGYGRFDHVNALPVWLQRAGYATGHIGKHMNGYELNLGVQQPPGWTEWYGAVDGSTYLMWGHTLVENGVACTYGDPLDEDPRTARGSRPRTRPGSPRTSMTAANRCSWSTRRSSGSSPALRGSGELDDTYVILTSDNGYLQGEHGVPSGKLLPYEASTRVPLLVRGPGIPAGAVSRELVGNVDLAPTIAGLAGALPGRPPDGRSLLPYARDPRRCSRRALLHETGGRHFVRRRDHDAAGPPAVRRVLTYRGVRTQRWLYVEHRNGERELYDLARDPHELRSVHADPARRRTLRVLRATLRRLAHCRGAGCDTAPGSGPAPQASAGGPEL